MHAWRCRDQRRPWRRPLSRSPRPKPPWFESRRPSSVSLRHFEEAAPRAEVEIGSGTVKHRRAGQSSNRPRGARYGSLKRLPSGQALAPNQDRIAASIRGNPTRHPGQSVGKPPAVGQKTPLALRAARNEPLQTLPWIVPKRVDILRQGQTAASPSLPNRAGCSLKSLKRHYGRGRHLVIGMQLPVRGAG